MNQREKSIVLMIVNFILVYVIMMQVYAFWVLRILLWFLVYAGLYRVEQWLLNANIEQYFRRTKTIKSRKTIWSGK